MSEYISNSMDICEEKTTSLSNFRHEGPDHGDHYDRGAWHTDPEREEIVKPFINSILTDHEVFSYVENVLYPNGVVPANDVRRKGRKGVLARLTRPVSRLNALDVVFAACRDASFGMYVPLFQWLSDTNDILHYFLFHKYNIPSHLLPQQLHEYVPRRPQSLLRTCLPVSQRQSPRNGL